MPKLPTPDLEDRLPELYSQEDVADPTVQVLLLGANGWAWALYEYSEIAPTLIEKSGIPKIDNDSRLPPCRRAEGVQEVATRMDG